MQERLAVLFVCLGNICRSPLAEAAFRREASRRGLDVEIDSAGTGHWHIGSPPDKRAQAVARRHGIEIGPYRARQVTKADFYRFTHIVAMDCNNLAALRACVPDDAQVELSLLMDHVGGRKGQPVIDPYYGELEGFDVVWKDVVSGASGLVDHLLALLAQHA